LTHYLLRSIQPSSETLLKGLFMPRSVLPGRRSFGVRLLAVPAAFCFALTACTAAGGGASDPEGEVDDAFLEQVDAALAEVESQVLSTGR
jgi:hypothetical protein